LRDGDYWQLRFPFPATPDSLRDQLRDQASVLPPNTRFKYSNMGYSLLGLVVEHASGIPFRDYVRAHIVERIGLRNTAPDYVAERAADYAQGYTHTQLGLPRRPIDHVDTGAMSAATGFTSTAADLAAYFTAHCIGDDRLLSDTSKRRMQQPQWSPRDHEHYGLGMMLLDIGDRRLAGHTGGYPGHATKTWFDPAERFVVSVLTSSTDGPDLASGLLRLIDYCARLEPATPPAGVDPRSFGGRFLTLWGVYDIVPVGGRLLRIEPETNNPLDSLAELTIESATTARITKADGYTSPGEVMTFDFDAAETIARIRGESASSAWPQQAFERIFLGRERVAVPRQGE